MAGSPREERAWIRRAQEGSVADFEALFRHHWPRAYRAAYLVVHDAAAAEDIAQESFLAAVRSLERFDRRRPFGPWLHRIVVNRAIDWSRARTLRREAGEAGLESVAAAAPPDNPHARTLASALAELSPEHRAVIVLRHLLEYTPGEIAELTGLAVWGSLRDAVRGAQNTRPALFSLPVPRSRLLVNSAEGAWVVQSDGSKRLLDGYREASWSPHGLYLAAVHGDELRALEPNGDVHWSIGRATLASPRWSSHGNGDERVAYLAGSTLRVIGGDGRGDHALGRHVSAVAPAWRPRTHVVAYANGGGGLIVRNADTGSVQWGAELPQRPRALQWSGDGRYLLVRGASSPWPGASTGWRGRPTGTGSCSAGAAQTSGCSSARRWFARSFPSRGSLTRSGRRPCPRAGVVRSELLRSMRSRREGGRTT